MSSPLSLSGLMMVGPMHIAQLLQYVTVLGVAVLLLVTLRPFVRRRGGRIALVGAALLLARRWISCGSCWPCWPCFPAVRTPWSRCTWHRAAG